MNTIFRILITAFAALVGLSASAQNPPQKVNANYQFQSAGADSGGLRIPKFQTLPAHPNAFFVRNGALAYQVSDSALYAWDSVLAVFRFIGPVTAIGGGDTLDGSNMEIGGTLLLNPTTHLNGFNPINTVLSPGTGDAHSQNILSELISPSGGSRNTNFEQLVQSINGGQADTSHNEVMMWGWNPNAAVTDTLPDVHYAMEYNYNPFGTGRFIENHLQIGLPGGFTRRLFSSTTVLAPGDASIQTSNWEFSSSKFDWFDLQGQQCISLQTNNGKSNVTWYWDQNIDGTNVLQGWNSAGDTYNLSNQGGGTKTAILDGWNIVTIPSNDVNLATNFAFEKAGLAGPEAVCFLGNVYPSAIVPDTLSIGNPTSNWRESHIKNGYFKGSLVAGDQTAADPSAVLEVHSTTQGFGPPSMSTVQKLAIVSPRAGLQVYDNSLNQMSYFNGTLWVNF